MLTKRQQFTLLLIVSFAASIVLLTRGSQTIKQAYHRSQYLTWTTRPVKEISEGFLTYKENDLDAYITETTLPCDPVMGFNIFNRLYFRNGTLYAVSSTPAVFPHIGHILAKPEENMGGTYLDPSEKDMKIINLDEAKHILGERATLIRGSSFILYDNSQFMGHYYHWWGEIILGAMRMYSSLSLIPGIESPLPDPARFILPNINDHKWRDRAGVDGPLMRAAFPNSPIELKDFWQDLIALNVTFVFDRAMIVSRPAAHKSPLATVWYKMISSTMNIMVPAHFWEPIRRRVIQNIIGYVPVMDNAGAILSHTKSLTPIVTYISRQGGIRRLAATDHEGLVKALNKLEKEGLCKVQVVLMETLTFSEQIKIAAESTVMVGIHGNGLTHQLWMPSGPRSTVLEIFFPRAYAHDYEILSRNMGHKHYAIWNDTTLTFPEGKWYRGVTWGNRSDFNGYSIPVHGPTIAKVIRERLTESLL